MRASESASRAASLGSSSTTEMTVTPAFVAEADEDVARARRVAGLDAVDLGHRPHEQVAVEDHPRVGARAQRRAREVGDGTEEGIAPQDERELDQVLGAGVVAGVVEPDRVGVVGVGQPELAGAAVHERDERALRAAHARRQRRRRVVGAGQQQPAQQVGHGHALPAAQPDDRLGRRRAIGHGGHDLPELCVLEGHQRSHELGGRGHGARTARLALIDDVPGGRLDEDRRGRANGGRRGGRARRPREGEGKHEPEGNREQRGRRAAVARDHRESLTRWPAWSVSASSLGFRRLIVVSVTPVLIEIADRVSPDFTT